MKHKNPASLFAAVVLFIAVAPLVTHAQSLPQPNDGETVLQYKNRVASAVPDASKKPVKANLAEVPNQIAAKTTSVAAPGGFPDRVNDALADFLPLVAFAVNSVSTANDKKSVTVAFNPLPAGGYGAVSVSATVAEPQVFQPVSQAIDQAVRDTQVKKIQSGIDDFGDVTWSATYGYQPRASSWEKASTLWGRDYSIYKNLLEAAASKIASESEATLACEQSFNIALETPLPAKKAAPDTRTFGEIKSAIHDGTLKGFNFDGYVECLHHQGEWLANLDAATRALHFEALPALIDNQPQLTLTGTYRNPNQFVGPRTYGVGITLETGNRNFNSVLRAYRQALEKGNVAVINQPTPVDVKGLGKAIEAVAAETKTATQTKFVLNLGFQRHDQYDLDYPYQTSATAQRLAAAQSAGSASLHLPATDEWTGKLQWSTLFLSTTVAGGNPRLDVSAEYLKVHNDPARQDRTIARVSYTVPLQGGGSLPFTLTYANRGEFLGEQNKRLSAHLGLSWKIDAANTKGSGS